MAKLNLNAVPNNVCANDKVVAGTSIGLKLVNGQTAAVLSQGWPVSIAGPEPMQATMRGERMRDYRDAHATRAGRSVRPAGCHASLGHLARPAALLGRLPFASKAGKRASTSAR